MRTMTMVALVLAVGVAGAQQPPPKKAKTPPPADPATTGTTAPKKSALEEALELALTANPDLRVAASKLALAEAELSRTRLQVTQKVATAYADVEIARATTKEMERQLTRYTQLHKNAAVSSAVVSKAELQVVEAKAKLAAVERELAHLQGKGTRTGQATNDAFGLYLRTIEAAGNTRIFDSRTGKQLLIEGPSSPYGPTTHYPFPFRQAKSEVTDKMRQALQKKVTRSSGQKMTLADYLALVKKTAGVGIQADTKDEAWKETVDFDFEDVTVGGMLQFLEDNLLEYKIVVRDYGLLVVAKDRVPPGALTLSGFLHAESPGQVKKAAPLPLPAPKKP